MHALRAEERQPSSSPPESYSSVGDNDPGSYPPHAVEDLDVGTRTAELKREEEMHAVSRPNFDVGDSVRVTLGLGNGPPRQDRLAGG